TAFATPLVLLSMTGAFGLSQRRFFCPVGIWTAELAGARNCGTAGILPFQVTRPWREPALAGSNRLEPSVVLAVGRSRACGRESSQPGAEARARRQKVQCA